MQKMYGNKVGMEETQEYNFPTSIANKNDYTETKATESVAEFLLRLTTRKYVCCQTLPHCKGAGPQTRFVTTVNHNHFSETSHLMQS